MPVNHVQLRRLYEAAERDRRDGDGNRCLQDIEIALAGGQLKPDDFRLRPLFENFVENGRELIDYYMSPGSRGREESLARLIESDVVNTAAFANITGQIVYNRILQAYQSEDFVFSAMIPDVQTEFDGEKIAGIGQIGDKAELIDETGEYPMAGVSEDWIRTPQTRKRGLVVPITKEAIFFDRTGLILQRCSEVGAFLGLNKEKRAIDCVIDENTTTHRYNRKDRGAVATYGDNSGNHDWDNLQSSNALEDWTDVDNAEQLLYSILDPNTDEPIAITGGMPKLICTRGLSATAMRIKSATEVVHVNPGYATSGTPIETRSPNPMANTFDVVTSRLLASRLATDTDWFYGHPERAFAYMQNWPLTTAQAPVNSELEFQRDIVMRWKASERGQYATLDPRYMEKNTAS